MANLTSDEYGEEIRQQIDDNVTHDFSYYGPTFDVQQNAGTAHMNILAPNGAAVSLTTSLNTQYVISHVNYAKQFQRKIGRNPGFNCAFTL